jgi:uncharacterized protein (TIGR03663 family)
MRQSAQFGEAVHDVRVRLRDLYGNAGVWLLAVSLFVVVSGVLYSSFLTNFPKGIYDAVRTFKIWSGTAVSANQHVWYAYLQWLAKEEPLILVLGTMGAILALFRACSRFAVFVGLWWIGLLLAYSTLAYKTPWLTLNMIVPLAISAGIGIEEIYRSRRDRFRFNRIDWTMAGLALILVIPGMEAVTLNFYQYDDPRHPYVYAQTQRGFLRLINDIETIARRQATDENTTMSVTSREYWPLPWYLRNYRNVGYPGHMIATQAAIVIGSVEQERQLFLQLGRPYRRVDSYPLRPGLKLVLFVRD